MCISTGLQDQIDPASWYMRKQGWAGAYNPANVISSRIEGKTFGGSGKTETEKRAARMSIRSGNQSSVSGPAGHVRAIAARRARVES